MKQLLLVAFLCLAGLTAPAQPAAWTFALPGEGVNALMDVATDAAGNAYVTGRFTGSTRVGGTLITSARPGVCLFIAKISPGGQVLRVTKLEGATDALAFAIAADAAGNTFVTGYFTGTLTYNGGQQTTGQLTSLGGLNILLVKCGANGTVRWVQQANGGSGGAATGSSYGYGVTLDQAGNSYICGLINGSDITFGGGSFGARRRQGFLASYSPRGQLRWAKVLAAYPSQAAVGASSPAGGVAVDEAGHCYLSGVVFQGWTVDGLTLTSQAGNQYLARFDARTGQPQWAVALPGASDGRALAVDRQGAVYLGGRFTGTATFGSRTLTSAGGYDGFVVRLGPTGTVQWATALGGPDNDLVSDLAVAPNSRRPFVAGTLGYLSPGARAFVAELNPGGRVQRTAAGGPGTSDGGGLALDGRANAYTTGFFTGEVHLGPHALAAPATQPYLARYGKRMPGGGGADVSNAPALFPNPAQNHFTLRLESPVPAGRATLHNQLGHAVAERPLPGPGAAPEVVFDTSALPDGLYTLRLETPQRITTRLVMVQH